RRGHLARGQPDRPWCRARAHPQVRRLVHLRGRPARAGQGERARVPARQPRPRGRDREEDQGEARPRRPGRQARRDARRLLSVSRFAEPPTTGAAAHDDEPDAYEVARTIALRLLEAAPRSRHQLGERLARRGVAPEVAERVLDRFVEVGLLDDAAYAGMLVRSRRASRGLAPRALALELRRAGIDEETAAAALADLEVEQDESDEEVATRLVRRRLRSMRGLEDDVALR